MSNEKKMIALNNINDKLKALFIIYIFMFDIATVRNVP